MAEVESATRETTDKERHRNTFLRLISQYEASLRRLSAAYVDRTADREDLFQEIAMGIWRAIPHFRGDASERTWLYRIAHNIAATSAGKLYKRGHRETPIPEAFDHSFAGPDAEQRALNAEKVRQLKESIRGLATLERQIILLHLEGLSYSDIEDVTGLSETAIAARLSRIREKLRGAVRGKEAGRP